MPVGPHVKPPPPPPPPPPSHVIVIITGHGNKQEKKFDFGSGDTWGNLKDQIAQDQKLSRHRLLLTYNDRPASDGTSILSQVKHDDVHVYCTVHEDSTKFTKTGKKIRGRRL